MNRKSVYALLLFFSFSFHPLSTRSQVAYEFDDNPSEFLWQPGDDELDIRDCAANNYGTWAAIPVSDGEGWALFSNSLQSKDFTNPAKIIPNGVVARGPFNNQSQLQTASVRVATNLRGSTPYVFINTAGDGFEIQGFDDGQIGTKRIDVKFNNFNNTTLDRDFVDPGFTIQSFPDVVPNSGVSLDLNEANWRDNFDVAMDANFLYSVWASGTGLFN